MANEKKLNQINAAASQRCSDGLSKLINKKIEVVFTQPLVTNVKEIPSLISSQEIGVGVYLPIKGGVLGSSLFLFPKETAFNLCDLVMKRAPSAAGRGQDGLSRGQLSFLDEGILKEIGNILLGNYLAVLSNILKSEIVEGMPILSFGMFGAMLDEIVVNFAKDAPEALVVKIEFISKTRNINGRLLLMFKAKGIEALLDAL